MTRILDLILAITALAVFAPLLILVIIILRYSGEGEVFFKQKRMGVEGQTFDLIKFATMLKNSPNMANGTVTIKNDPRVMPFGKFLRKTKINELPQLLNIIQGDMSFIGPRPLTSQTFSFYAVDSQAAISRVMPGLSGIGSIVFRGEEELLKNKADPVDFYSKEIAPYKGELEQWFVENKSLWIYVVCIALTINVVIRPSTNVHWRVFPSLPPVPNNLRDVLVRS